ncbi:hypothetical protein AYO21_11987 [Fonsecaea monophora]|uniref:Uncharacterized protein n=1 Tax=Fonsecaea monophora TaxID=254056 RepID=A0A177ER21_9EURO|nr:hypothetical protein AYO21_11987 [Fonsecaea monophora]OAG33901.1 hypothetical protein AYO21_11987 [Fonsecaea monophora]
MPQGVPFTGFLEKAQEMLATQTTDGNNTINSSIRCTLDQICMETSAENQGASDVLVKGTPKEVSHCGLDAEDGLGSGSSVMRDFGVRTASNCVPRTVRSNLNHLRLTGVKPERTTWTNPVTGWNSVYAIGTFPKSFSELNAEETEELANISVLFLPFVFRRIVGPVAGCVSADQNLISTIVFFSHDFLAWGRMKDPDKAMLLGTWKDAGCPGVHDLCV